MALAAPGGVSGGGAPGDAGVVDEPRARTVVAVGAVALAGGERSDGPGPDGGGDRVVVLEFAQDQRLGVGSSWAESVAARQSSPAWIISSASWADAGAVMMLTPDHLLKESRSCS